MENVSEKVGGRIRLHRNLKGLTQEDLAHNSGINISFLGDIERGKKKPSVESLEKILRGLGMTFQEFFSFEGDVKPFKDCSALEKINLKLLGRTASEVEMIYDVIQRILEHNDEMK